MRFFTLRRLLEVWGRTRPLTGEPPAEHDSLYLLFVDLSKAFDSVNRQKLWALLSDKLGAPPHFISMLVRVHERMQAHVLHTGRLGPTVRMRTGVRQGSVEVPTLYLLFYAFVLAEWRRRCRQQHGPSHGVERVSSRDGALREPSRARRAQRGSVRITECGRQILIGIGSPFPPTHLTLDTVLCEFGVDMNLTKTEWMMVFGCDKFPDQAPLPGARQLFIRGMPVPRANLLKYV